MGIAEMQSLPGFLLLALPGDVGPLDFLSAAARAIVAAGGRVVTSGDAARNAGLEVGTPPKSVILATWSSEAAVIAAWAELGPEIARLGTEQALVALAGTCLAESGRPSFPIRENASPIASEGPAAFMLIEGVTHDPEPMARYRDIIFPMISERGGYYLIYAPRQEVTILQGDWRQSALIVSRWPDAERARDFWYCDLYQTVAIPTRAGAGTFSVLLIDPPPA